jgi:DNA-binding transcriptional LysR family regulator
VSFKRGQLHYFVAVAEEGQITRAARKLHIAQPALSQAIAQLEAQLGVQLLERHPHGVTLTPAGEVFYEKASAAVAAASEAELTAQSLARARDGTIELGFLGVPPGLDSPGPLQAFAELHPNIDIRYHELPFPTLPMAAWLEGVDVAICHAPPAAPKVWTQTIRVEPRCVLAPQRHRLVERESLTVAEVLDESFIGLHPLIEPAWAAFWSLDGHRGGPPQVVTPDRAANPQEVIAALAVRDAITTVPCSVARVLPHALSGLAAIPLEDADPAVIQLVGHGDRRNPLVAAILEFAENLVAGDPPDPDAVEAEQDQERTAESGG